MPDWTTPSNGDWTDTARWTGGVPNAAGAIANFTNTTLTSGSSLISIGATALPNQEVRIGTINFSTGPSHAWSIVGGTGAIAPTLTMQGLGGGPAFINADTNGSTNNSRITETRGLRLNLASDTIVTTLNSDTVFEITATIIGSRELQKHGFGRLLLKSASTFDGGLRIQAGTVELGNATAAGTGEINLRNATLRLDATATFANDLIVSGNFSSVVNVAAGRTATLTGDIVNRGAGGAVLNLGFSGDTGTLVLAASSVTHAPGASWFIGAGTVRFGNAANAAGAFSGSEIGRLAIGTAGTLDTGGFAATIRAIDFSGGTLRTSTGTLDVSLIVTSSVLQTGGIVGTAGADRLVFDIIASNGSSISLGLLVFSTWSDVTDSITIRGSGLDDVIGGTTQADTMTGNAGDDYLDGNGGPDILIGGIGNDIYALDDIGNVTIVEVAGEGTDTVEISNSITSFTLATDLENLTFLLTTSNQLGVGNAADNVITAAGPRATLAGLAGNDRLVVTDASINGAELIGGTGDDTYVVATRQSTTFELVGEGTDTVETTSQIFLLSANIENLRFTNAIAHGGVGNALANLITGGTASDELYGREGNDTLDGGSGVANALFGQEGDDRYFIRVAGDSIIEFANQGRDQVTLDGGVSSFTLPANVEEVTSIGGAKVIVGNGLDNMLGGNSGNDQIVGMDGNDVIIGASGADQLQGGAGADQFLYGGGETGFDRILDFVSGTDKIALFASFFTPTANVGFVAGAGAVATSANSTFLYDTNTGIVSYDDDGNGAGLAVQLAQLNIGQALTGNDFIFV